MVLRPVIGDRGSGPAVLLLHGQPGAPSDWVPVANRLVDEFRVITPDRPGYGSGSPAALVANADAAVDLLDDLGIESATVAGHSWGGAVALLLASRHPDRVRGLVLVSSVPSGFRPERVDRLLASRVLGPALAFVGIPMFGRLIAVPRIRALVSKELAAIDMDVFRPSVAEWRRPGIWKTFVYEQRALLKEAPLLERAVDEVRTPTTIVHGAIDSVCSLADAKKMASTIEGSHLIEVPDCGHMLPLQWPDGLAWVIAETADLAIGA